MFLNFPYMGQPASTKTLLAVAPGYSGYTLALSRPVLYVHGLLPLRPRYLYDLLGLYTH